MQQMTFRGERLRQARRAANLSQSDLARRIGAHVTSVSDWERGRNEPSARHLASIARETGCALSHFFDEPDEEEDAATSFLVDLGPAIHQAVRAASIARVFP